MHFANHDLKISSSLNDVWLDNILGLNWKNILTKASLWSYLRILFLLHFRFKSSENWFSKSFQKPTHCGWNNWPIQTQKVPKQVLFNGLHIFTMYFQKCPLYSLMWNQGYYQKFWRLFCFYPIWDFITQVYDFEKLWPSLVGSILKRPCGKLLKIQRGFF